MRGKREMKRKRNPWLLALGVIFAAELVLTVGLVFLRSSGHDREAPEEPEVPSFANVVEPVKQEQTVPEQGSGSVTEPAELTGEPQNRFVISFLGDCTLTSSHYTNHFENIVGDDLAYPFSHVAEILTADDLTLANLECSFSEKRLESESEYAFCGQPKYARALTLGGVDCVSMANNHTDDFGMTGVEDTVAALEDADVAGIQGGQGVCFDLRHDDGSAVRVGIYVLPFNGGTEQMKKGAERLREEGADIVVACMHTGAEKIYVPTERQTYLAHAAINGGADVVVGTHPHVLQPVEAYRGGLILYSIGNFCFGGNRNPGDKDTVIAQMIVHREETGVSWEMTFVPCCVSSAGNKNDYRPTPYPEGTESYQRCLSKLAAPWDTTTAEEAAAAKAAAET